MKNILDKVLEEIKTHVLLSIAFLSKILPLW